mmetsp:Transcript_2666/g.5883  ORF Transcript_2666/g.5883 Transcript_2666/m.5883 type:complete len:139 (-) Transcript_2666:240-656(-)
MDWFADGVFWFGVVGAGAAALQHALSPHPTILDLTPCAADPQDKTKTVPAATFWGGYAFGVMNGGFCSIGLWAAFCGSTHAKQAFMLGTSVLFDAFSVVWLKHGHETGKTDYRKHALKIASFGLLFLSGFVVSVISQK